MEQSGKIAVVTGGSRGLGKNTVLRLAESGIDCILTYNQRREEAEDVVAAVHEIGRVAVALPLDVSAVALFDNFFVRVAEVLSSTWQRTTFDVLVNNAGIEAHARIAETPEEMFDRLCNVHFKGVYFFTQKAFPLLADNGRIVNLSTGLARFAIPGYAAYGAMKGAVETLTRYMAKEFGARGITANVVAPGPIDTDFTKPGFDANPHVPQFLASQTALGRVGVPDDVGGVVAFLCSEQARWITAQRIEVSGGIFL